MVPHRFCSLTKLPFLSTGLIISNEVPVIKEYTHSADIADTITTISSLQAELFRQIVSAMWSFLTLCNIIFIHWSCHDMKSAIITAYCQICQSILHISTSTRPEVKLYWSLSIMKSKAKFISAFSICAIQHIIILEELKLTASKDNFCWNLVILLTQLSMLLNALFILLDCTLFVLLLRI